MEFVPPKEKCKAILLTSSDQIRALQKQLNSILTAEGRESIKEDGWLGEKTKKALMEAQALFKIRADGIYGEQTKAAIAKYLNEYLPAKREAEKARSQARKEEIGSAQAAKSAGNTPFLNSTPMHHGKPPPAKRPIRRGKNYYDCLRLAEEADRYRKLVPKKPPAQKPEEAPSPSQLLEKRLSREIGAEKAQSFIASLGEYCIANGISAENACANLNNAFESINATARNLWNLRELSEKKYEWVRSRYSPKGTKEELFEIIASSYFIERFFGISAEFMLSIASRETQFRDISGYNGKGPWQLTSSSSISELKNNYWLGRVQDMLPFGLEAPITSLQKAKSSILNNSISAAETILLKIAVLNEEEWGGKGNWKKEDLKTNEQFRKKVLERYNAHEDYMYNYSKDTNNLYLYISSTDSVVSV